MRKYFLLYLSSVCLFTNCRKLTDVGLPRTQTTSSLVYSNDQAAISSVNGLQSELGRINLTLANGGVTLYCGLASGELTNSVSSLEVDQFRNNNLTPDNSLLNSRYWSQTYRNIYHINSIIEGLAQSEFVSDSIRTRLTAEALFWRAFHYYYLMSIFGDVPLILTTDFRESAIQPRKPIQEIVLQIENDLLSAINGFQHAAFNKNRPGKFSCFLLLSRTYLMTGNWIKAKAATDSIVLSNRFQLATLSNVFQPSSIETILQLPRDNNNCAEGIAFVPASSTVLPPFVLTNDLMNSFELGDQRKVQWTKTNIVNGSPYPYPFKYKVRASSPITEHLIIFRYAEVYLIQSEAKIKLGYLDEGKQDINRIRTRAGLANTASIDEAALIADIIKERKTEFFAEWSHRWFDLKRLGLADAILGPLKGSNWSSTDQLFPIPQAEIDANPFLIQNPGY